jgi:hypothetical protein
MYTEEHGKRRFVYRGLPPRTFSYCGLLRPVYTILRDAIPAGKLAILTATEALEYSISAIKGIMSRNGG